MGAPFTPTEPRQVWFDEAVAPIRAGVGRLFGTMRRVYGYRRVRSHGPARNGARPQPLGTAIDPRRAPKPGPA